MLARRPPNWGPFPPASGLGRIIRRRVRAGTERAALGHDAPATELAGVRAPSSARCSLSKILIDRPEQIGALRLAPLKRQAAAHAGRGVKSVWTGLGFCVSASGQGLPCRRHAGYGRSTFHCGRSRAAISDFQLNPSFRTNPTGDHVRQPHAAPSLPVFPRCRLRGVQQARAGIRLLRHVGAVDEDELYVALESRSANGTGWRWCAF